MDKEIVKYIFSHLIAKGFLSEDFASNEDQFMEKMFIINDERKEIIKALILAFSDEYKTDLQKVSVLDIVLARKIYELGFIDKENQLNFVLGKCKQEYQEKVYKKIFKALKLTLISKEDSTNKFSSSLITENLFKMGSDVKANKLKKQGKIKQSKKNFNINQAMQNLESVLNTLQDASHLLEQKSFIQPVPQQSWEITQNEGLKFDDVTSSIESLALTMERHISKPLMCNRLAINLDELGASVGELQSGLQYVAEGTQFSSTKATEIENRFDLDKMLEQAEDIGRTTKMLKCYKNKCFLMEDGFQFGEL